MNKPRMLAAVILAIALFCMVMMCQNAQAKASVEDEPDTILYDPSPRGQIGT